MAIYHLSAKIIGRSSGRSSVGAAAYRAGEKLYNNYDGVTHDYTKKSGVIYTEIILPDNAPTEYHDRSTLWNAVEKSEKRLDSQTAREIEIALPIELSHQEQIFLIRDYIEDNFTSKGMCADFAIHDNNSKAVAGNLIKDSDSAANPHAHILLTTRDVSKDGFEGKNREWNKKAYLENWRENWADSCNKWFRAKGLDERIDHRTLEAQGIDREPTMHLGPAACAMERKGIISERGEILREIIQANAGRNPEITAEFMIELKSGYKILEKEINELKEEKTTKMLESRELLSRADNIAEIAQNLRDWQERLVDLLDKREDMSFWESRESKSRIDDDIQRVQYTINQSGRYMSQKFGVEPQNATAEVRNIEARAEDLQKEVQNLDMSLTPYVQERDVLLFEYQRQKLLAENSLDNGLIKGLLDKMSKDRTPESVRDRLADSRAESALDRVSEENFRRILESVTPSQAEVLMRQRAIELVRERTRSHERSR